jgi:hypothetical protein
MGSRLAASDLGFTRDRHFEMRTSATANVRWHPGTTRLNQCSMHNVRSARLMNHLAMLRSEHRSFGMASFGKQPA